MISGVFSSLIYSVISDCLNLDCASEFVHAVSFIHFSVHSHLARRSVFFPFAFLFVLFLCTESVIFLFQTSLCWDKQVSSY